MEFDVKTATEIWTNPKHEHHEASLRHGEVRDACMKAFETAHPGAFDLTENMPVHLDDQMNQEAARLGLVKPASPVPPEVTQPVTTEQPTEQPDQEQQEQDRQVREVVVNTMLPVWGTETYAAVDTVLGYMDALKRRDLERWDEKLAKHIREDGLQQTIKDIHDLAVVLKK